MLPKNDGLLTEHQLSRNVTTICTGLLIQNKILQTVSLICHFLCTNHRQQLVWYVILF